MPDLLKKFVSLPSFTSFLNDFNSKKSLTISGINDASLGFFCAALNLALKDRPILLVVSQLNYAQEIFSQLQQFQAQIKEKIVLFPLPEDFEASGQCLKILNQIEKYKLVIAPIKALMWKIPSAQDLSQKTLQLELNLLVDPEEILSELVEMGYRRVNIVGERGEFAVRGGIIDVFCLQDSHPLRIEFEEEKIVSLRFFSAASQTTLNKQEKALILPVRLPRPTKILTDYFPGQTAVVLNEPIVLERMAVKQEDKKEQEEMPYFSFEEMRQKLKDFSLVEISSLAGKSRAYFDFSPAPVFYPQVDSALPAIRQKLGQGFSVSLLTRHKIRMQELFADVMGLEITSGNLRLGFEEKNQKLLVLSDYEIFGLRESEGSFHIAAQEGVGEIHKVNFNEGDYVVHEKYGIGLYRGLTKLEIDHAIQEYLLVEYKDGDEVFVPLNQMGLVQRYASPSEHRPQLNGLNTKKWEHTTSRVKKALKNITRDLIQLYAAREKSSGFSFPPDSPWIKDLEESFPYEETPDQMKAILEVKKDMEEKRPMDRLLCGDVGYGKTEVAIRAAAKALSAGKQAAILVPTTILAEQHYLNFKRRFAPFPYVVEVLSRFRSKEEQKTVLKSLAQGGVDIIIGTHRLLQKDVIFRDLGLLIVDEEQRFGVSHKEKLKALKKNVDVLTMTATPIPRTLYFSLSGIRNMSLINTAPLDRSPVKTYVANWNEALIKEAVLREIERGGQIYFLHNFVESIERTAVKLKKLLPDARIIIGHGQMAENELRRVMNDFTDHKFDILLSTAIIESGLDIPNVNTIIIDRADRFGLADLYQLRGRVGRSSFHAYAYLLYHEAETLTDKAIERLKAIQEFTALGSGYKLAMKDLEIRGAGNLLGANQHGHMLAIGFDMYCRLLEEAVKRAKGEKIVPQPQDIILDLKYDAFIPSFYIEDDKQRIALYRRMNFLDSRKELAALKTELIDRYGKLPQEIELLFRLIGIKILARNKGISSVKQEQNKIYFEFFDAIPSFAQEVKKRLAIRNKLGILNIQGLNEKQALVLLEKILS